MPLVLKNTVSPQQILSLSKMLTPMDEPMPDKVFLASITDTNSGWAIQFPVH